MASIVDEIRAYVGFGPDDEAALRRLAPALPRVLPAIVDDFYRVIQEHAEAHSVFVDAAQIGRLRQSLGEWLTRLLGGAFDDLWFERCSAIGRRHVEVGLPQRFMPLAMSRLRRWLVELAVETESASAARCAAAVAAIDKALDLELTVMLASYAEAHHARVRQSERLAALGQLTASVGHELKNPLGVINTSLLLVQKQLALPESQRDAASLRTHLERIGRSSRQAAQTSSQLLDYARSKRLQLRTVELATLIEDVRSSADVPAGVEIETSCVPADATASVDPGDLVQLLVNLVRNSVQSIRESGHGRRVVLGARRDAVGVVFSVSDDGPGIAPEHLPRVFEPLFTTRTGGTGLGLAIARDIVEAHGGRITVASTPGRGAQFTVLLPQVHAPAHGAPPVAGGA